MALGVTTNQLFLARCLAHPAFAKGAATTAFIGEHLGELLQRDAQTHARAAALAAPLLIETTPGAKPRSAGRRLANSLPIGLRFVIDAAKRVASVTHQGRHRYQAEIDGRHFVLDLIEIGAHTVRFACDGVMESAVYSRDGTRLLLHYRGQAFEIEDQTLAAAARQEGTGSSDGKLHASMNGRVVAVLVAAGDRVSAGQAMVTLEAMKMEHIHAAPHDGVVKALHVAVGEQVPARHVVAQIEPDA